MAAPTASEQLIVAIPAMFPGESTGFCAKAVMAVSKMPEGVAAGLLRLPEDLRQAAIVEAVQGEYVLRHARRCSARAGHHVWRSMAGSN